METERKGKRLLGMILALVLVFNAILQGSLPVFAAGEAKPVEVKITKFDLQNRDHKDTEKIWYTDTFYLAMEWDATKHGANIHQGDYFDVTLPSKMWFPADTTARDFNLVDPSGVILATAHVTPGPKDVGGTVRVTFTDKVEDKYNVKGTLTLASKFDKDQIKIGEKNNFTITVNSEVIGQSHSEDDGVIIDGPRPVEDEYLFKWGGKVQGVPTQAHWHVRINHKKANLSNVVISDTLVLTGESFIPDSFRLLEVTFDQYGRYHNEKLVPNLASMLTFGEGNKTFTLNLGDIGDKQYHLDYKSTYTPGTKLINHIILRSSEINRDWRASHRSAESSGTANGDLASKIKLIKVDAEDNSIPLENAVFTVTKFDGSTFELTTGPDGTITSPALEQGQYKVKEKVAPRGYELGDEDYTLTIGPNGGAIQTITNKPTKIDISGTKVWLDKHNQDGKRPASIIVNLLADGVKVKETEVRPDADGNWKYSFTGLRQFRGSHEIKYTVTENPVEGYTPDINGYEIVNKRIPEVVDIAGTKTWDDANNQDGKRPGKIIVNLLADGTQFKTLEVRPDGDGNWKYSFSGLPKYKAGKEIKYTVTEEAVAGYTPEINGYDITNKYTPEVVEVSGTKTWDDANNQDGKRPEMIKVNLLADGVSIKMLEVKADADGNWKYSFTGLPKYKDGKEIKYTVIENAVEGYTTEINGFDITNKYTPEVIEVAGTKSWDDANNQDGKRPEMIKVNLFADGTQIKTVEVKADADGNWKYSFTGLPKYKAGKEIKYTVTENAVADYTTEINGFDIKNSYKPGMTGVTVTKRWDDADNKDKIRPTSIRVQLYADGEKVGEEVVLKASDNWTYTWKDLPAMKNGKAIKYTVNEVGKVAGYTVSVNDKDHGNIIITNSHKPKRPPVPKTGDGTDLTVVMAGLGVALVAICSAIVVRKKFADNQ